MKKIKELFEDYKADILFIIAISLFIVALIRVAYLMINDYYCISVI